MNEPEYEPQPPRFNIASITVSVITIVLYVVIYFQGAGQGPSILGNLIALFVVAGVGLTIAFILAMTAMMRGEDPMLVTLLALGVPPLWVVFLILHR